MVVTAGPYQNHTGTVCFGLLPFLEQSSLYNSIITQGGNATTATVNGVTAYNIVIKAFRCPSDPSPGGGTGLGYTGGPDATWAITNYGANYLVFGNPAANSQEGTARIPSSFPDGTSNTILFGERYAQYGTANSNGGPCSSLWANSGNPWRPQICCAIDNGGTGYANCTVFQVQPKYTAANGAWSGGQTPHTAVMNVGLGDGSVRGVSGGISQTTWQNACNPVDGNVLGSDW